MANDIYDLCVIGGGINGAGIARDAAGRGLKVLLLEAQDLAAGTSSKSTKLIHGGLRYLENFDFKLVRESLQEREVLLKQAPHIIWPQKFVLPHTRVQRPFWMIKIGLFLYDRLAKRHILPDSEGIKLRDHRYGHPLEREYKKGITYADCWVEDSRLVVLNAMDAKAYGANIETYTSCEALEVEGGLWKVSARDSQTGSKSMYFARRIVNAAGPWVSEVLKHTPVAPETVPDLRLVKGSHIIVDRLYEGRQAYLLQQPDGRIVFVLPYENDYTLIGTTEENYDGSPYEAQISDDELEYLINAYNTDFKSKITVNDVLWAYSGVRPLFDDGVKENRKVSRDHKIRLHEGAEGHEIPPFLSVFGGKLTTYRVVAEEVVDQIMALANQPDKIAWTKEAALPGGDIPDANFDEFLKAQVSRYRFLSESLLRRYAIAYGTRIERFLDGASSLEDLGEHYGDNVYEAEIIYLLHFEFAKTLEDILWRRSKLGLHISSETRQNIEGAIPGLLKRMETL